MPVSPPLNCGCEQLVSVLEKSNKQTGEEIKSCSILSGETEEQLWIRDDDHNAYGAVSGKKGFKD